MQNSILLMAAGSRWVGSLPQDRDSSNDVIIYVSQVPLLNAVAVHRLPHHSLVRYRCMIQDQFDPEFYFKVYHLRRSADGSNSSVSF